MIELSSTTTAATVCALVAASALLVHAFLHFQARKYPPGPIGEPIIGSYRRMPELHPWLYYTELKKKYGDLVFVRVLTQKILLVGTYDVAHHFLSKRGVNNSDRPNFPLIHETLGIHPPMSPYGQKWKEERRMYHAHIGKEAVKSQYRIEIETQEHDWVLKCLDGKNRVSQHVYVAVLKTFLQSVYGIKITAENEELLEVAIKATELGSNTIVPGKFWVNLVPGLAKLRKSAAGLSNWGHGGKHMDVWQRLMTRLIKEPFDITKAEDKQGLGKISFLSSMIHDSSTSLNEEQIMYTAGSSFLAGTDTTGGTIQFFLYAMMLYPEAQKKAQEEIDRVVGPDRLPTIDDLPSLPYTEAIFKETLRWRPVAPFAVPHSSLKDDVYNGYVIPKGTMIVQNTWGIAMDENMYPEPEKFIPERWLVKDPPVDPRLYAFGVGRRICPGMAFGESIVVAAFMTMFATVNVVKALDENGNEIEPHDNTTGKFITAALPFEFRLKPRSESAVALLRASVAAAGI